jgi:hyperosmotically inducible protein
MLMGGSATSTTGLGTDKRTSQQLTEDNTITATIRSRYALDSSIKSANISVDTYTGIVTLKGAVNGFDVRDRAVSIARNTDKVRSVNNQIIVNTSR